MRENLFGENLNQKQKENLVNGVANNTQNDSRLAKHKFDQALYPKQIKKAEDVLVRSAKENIDSKSPIFQEKKHNHVNESNFEEGNFYLGVKEKLLDDSSDFLTDIEKGGENEIFYQTLVETIPELGLSIEEAKGFAGEKLPNLFSVKTTPFKTDRVFLLNLEKNPVIKLFTNPIVSFEDKEKIGARLEEEGILPHGTTARFLSREYAYALKISPESKEFLEEFYSKFKNKEQLSNTEIKEFLKRAIKEEYFNKI